MINSPSSSNSWRREPAARTKKKKKLKHTVLTPYPQNSWQIIGASHIKAGPKYFQDVVLKDLVMSNKSNLLCFSYTSGHLHLHGPRARFASRWLPWDIMGLFPLLLPLPFNHRGLTGLHSFPRAETNAGILPLPSSVSDNFCKNSCWLHMWQDQTSLFRKLPIQRAIT